MQQLCKIVSLDFLLENRLNLKVDAASECQIDNHESGLPIVFSIDFLKYVFLDSPFLRLSIDAFSFAHSDLAVADAQSVVLNNSL